MLLKKFLLASSISLLLLFLNVHADGFYAGAGVGRDTANFHKKLTITDITSGANTYYKVDNQPGHGYLGNILAGYEWQFNNNFYLATELNFVASSLSYHGFFTDQEADEKSEADYVIDKGFGISVLPGYKIANDWLLYGRVGLVRSDFKYSEYKTQLSTQTVNGIHEREWLTGFRYGAGIAGDINKNITLRLEYDHINYQTFTNSTFPLAPNKSRVIKLTPSTDQVELDLVYKFS